MKKSHVKSLAIVCLMVLCMGQTMKLWFEDSSIRNFFYTLLSVDDSRVYTSEESLNSLVRPYRIISGVEDNKYYIDYAGFEDNPVKAVADEVISDVLKDASFAGSGEILWNNVLASKCLIYEYAVQMPADVFAKAYKQSGSNVASKVTSFNLLALLPAANGSITVFFINEEADYAYQYLLKSSSLAEDLLAELNDNGGQLHYSSSIRNNYDISTSNLFIAEFEEGYSFGSLSMNTPYGEILRSEVEEYVEGFFNNSAGSNFANLQDVFTFSSAYEVVRYYPENVLEYSNSAAGNAGDPGLDGAYSAAYKMLGKDTALVNDIYLSSYEQDDEGYTFYFDYLAEGFPVVFMTDLLEQLGLTQLGLTHPIEIRVEGGAVMKYKRYICQFTPSETGLTNASNDFINMIENVLTLKDMEEDDTRVDFVSLAYVAEEEAILNWYIEIEGIPFTHPL